MAESADGGWDAAANVVFLGALVQAAPTPTVTLPSQPLRFGAFTARFDPAGTFTIEGQGWPKLEGTWTIAGRRDRAADAVRAEGMRRAGALPRRRRRRTPDVRADRRSLPDAAHDPRPQLVAPGVRDGRDRAADDRGHGAGPPPAKPFAPATGSWPSFRGAQAAGVADGQQLPDTWNPKTGEHVRWRTPIPGLAHSSPIVWGDRVFVTSAVSSDPKATFRPGLYGDGDASADRSTQRWMLFALDAPTGKIVWERVAFEGAPRELRHIKSTYASATPATDGRIVVASFGSQGVYAYDLDGTLLWKADLGRLDVGAYDIPTVEWGTASSPIIWNDLVILQCDTQADSFLVALDAATGRVGLEDRARRAAVVGHADGGDDVEGRRARHQRLELRPRLRSADRQGAVAPRPQLEDHRADADCRRRPARRRQRPRARAADLRRQGRRARRPDARRRPDQQPGGRLDAGPAAAPTCRRRSPTRASSTCSATTALFDAYDLQTGEEIYRQRLPVVGSGFSASPVAADGKIYLSNEDGEILVVAAGRTFKHLATNSMGELLMATPALSNGTMFVRSSTSVSAISGK